MISGEDDQDPEVGEHVGRPSDRAEGRPLGIPPIQDIHDSIDVVAGLFRKNMNLSKGSWSTRRCDDAVADHLPRVVDP